MSADFSVRRFKKVIASADGATFGILVKTDDDVDGRIITSIRIAAKIARAIDAKMQEIAFERSGDVPSPIMSEKVSVHHVDRHPENPGEVFLLLVGERGTTFAARLDDADARSLRDALEEKLGPARGPLRAN